MSIPFKFKISFFSPEKYSKIGYELPLFVPLIFFQASKEHLVTQFWTVWGQNFGGKIRY